MQSDSFTSDLQLAISAIRDGQVIAYPTEAVYGLGCDPFNVEAVTRILTLKQRDASQGLILLIADWSQLEALIAPISDVLMTRVRDTWPGPVTWVFPKSKALPPWISGQHDSVAVRMTAHPVARALCQNAPLVSTSANIHGHPPARSLSDLSSQFPHGIDWVIAGDLGSSSKPSAIFDVLTGAQWR